jgi:hypothetical protein
MTELWQIEGKALGTPVTGSLGALITSLYHADYEERLVYPTLAAGKPVVSGVAWALSAAYAELVPLNGIPASYHVNAIVIENCTVDGVYELVLYCGAAHTRLGSIRFAQAGGYFGNMAYLLPGPIHPANEQIDMKAAISGGGAGTLTVSCVYRLYAP